MKTRPFQSGFTLIESVTVIALTGVLTAAALPRLTALTGEARYAALQSAGSALATVAVTAHGKFLIDGRGTQALEDVSLSMVEGYPAADQATFDAAGLGKGYVLYTHASDANAPAVPAGSMAIVPRSIAGTARARDCYLVYTQSRAPHTPPVVTEGAGASGASCT